MLTKLNQFYHRKKNLFLNEDIILFHGRYHIEYTLGFPLEKTGKNKIDF